MKKNTLFTVVAGILLVFLLAGCEDDTGRKDSSSSGNGPDDLNISSAIMLGPHKDLVAQNATITRAMTSANVSGGTVSMAFDKLNWPTEGGCDGGVYIFWKWEGQVWGGWFDWHGVNQTVKGLENIYGGYLDGKKPPAGQPVYFAIVNLKGAERTNVKKSDSTW